MPEGGLVIPISVRGGMPLVCRRCGIVKDESLTRRGKNNRARGNAIEREIGTGSACAGWASTAAPTTSRPRCSPSR